MTNCSQDPKIQMLRAEFGNEGYAVYWLILETIAGQYTRENPDCSLTLNERNWRKICEISPKKLRNFLFFCKKISVLESWSDGEMMTIKAPKLLKYGDEYTRKGVSNSAPNEGDLSGQAPDSVRASTSPSPSPSPSTHLPTGYLGGVPEPLPNFGNGVRATGGDA